MDPSGITMSLVGGFTGFLQPGVALMLAPLVLFLAAEAHEAPPPWRPRRAATRAFMLSLAFALGFAAAMAVLVAGFAGVTSLTRHLGVMRQIGALIIVFTGLSMLASFCRPGPQWARLPRPGGMWGGWLLGIGCALNWPPALGPVMGGIVRQLGAGGDGAMIMLSVYVVALATPFLLAAALIWGLAALLAHRDARTLTAGVMASGALVVCGLLMLTGAWSRLALAIATAAPSSMALG